MFLITETGGVVKLDGLGGVLTSHRAVLEITPEIPEIAGKNTSIPAMVVYLPDNSAGRNYWLLFITYLLVRWKIFDTFNRKLRKTII